jgi:hypothetical protein
MYLVVGLHGQRGSFWPGFLGCADRMHAGNEAAVGAEDREHGLAHAGHDAHVDHDVGAVADLDADLGDRRADRAHREGITYIVRPFMQPLKTPLRISRILAGSSQLLVGPASSFFSEQM